MQPKLKHGTVLGGMVKIKKQTSIYFLHHVLSLNVWIFQVWRLVIFTVETIQG